MSSTTAYGVVARCSASLPWDAIEQAVATFARTVFPRAAIAIGEDVDHGSLVSRRPEPFAFVNVTDGGRSFAFCRFRRFDAGVEFVFNLTESGQSSAQIDRCLASSLPLEVVRRELF
jgi:hypothetical protein